MRRKSDVTLAAGAEVGKGGHEPRAVGSIEKLGEARRRRALLAPWSWPRDSLVVPHLPNSGRMLTHVCVLHCPTVGSCSSNARNLKQAGTHMWMLVWGASSCFELRTK